MPSTLKGKNHAMKTQASLAFLAALSEDKRAMQVFAGMTQKERDGVLTRVSAAKTKADMQLIAASLSDTLGCAEDH